MKNASPKAVHHWQSGIHLTL